MPTRSATSIAASASIPPLCRGRQPGQRTLVPSRDAIGQTALGGYKYPRPRSGALGVPAEPPRGALGKAPSKQAAPPAQARDNARPAGPE
mgnify:CR=1 FL=1